MSLLRTRAARNVHVRLGHYECKNDEAKDCREEATWRIQSGRLREICNRDIHIIEEADAYWDL